MGYSMNVGRDILEKYSIILRKGISSEYLLHGDSKVLTGGHMKIWQPKINIPSQQSRA